MATQSIERLGLYVSYNEEKNGPFDDAVRISNELGCVTWFEPSPLDPQRLECPTDIIVKLTARERYFRGTLLAIRMTDTLSADFAAGERNHRPSAWRGKDVKDFRCVLFISRLGEVSKPREVEDRAPPQRPVYVSLYTVA